MMTWMNSPIKLTQIPCSGSAAIFRLTGYHIEYWNSWVAFTIFEFGPLKGGRALPGVTKSEVGIDPDSKPAPCKTYCTCH